MASSEEARLKVLRIKTGSVKRLCKEKLSYEKETEQQRQRVAKMKEEETQDEYVIKKQEEALQETKMMIQNSARRLAAALEDLEKALTSEQDLSENQIYKDGSAAVEEAKNLLASSQG